MPDPAATAPRAAAPDDALAARIPADRIVRKGFGTRAEVGEVVAGDFKDALIDWMRAHDHRLTAGRVIVELAREFGFCYGVDRAIDYAYETRAHFPGRRIFLTTEIIHNPRVNNRLIEMGIGFLSGPYARGTSHADVRPDDVVILPAFGVATGELDVLRERGCIIVDTTCGSVINVWKKVGRYAVEGFTSIIHGKYYHEETVATASQAASRGGAYLVVLNKTEAEHVCDFIRGGGDAAAFARRFEKAASPDFDPARHLGRVGVANQTTMLSSESLEISRMIGDAMRDRWGADALPSHFAAFDTICPATQERQDAMYALLDRPRPPDLMLVIGGFNSSNTGHLVEIAARYTRAYHIEDAAGLVSPTAIRHKPFMKEPRVDTGWLDGLGAAKARPAARTAAPAAAPASSPDRPVTVAFTGGASTPNRVIGEAILRTLALLGAELPTEVLGADSRLA